jgi:hypothetical protein
MQEALLSKGFISLQKNKINYFFSFHFLVKIKCVRQFNLLLERMKPPNARSVRTANDPNVLATIMFLPRAAVARNNPEAI